MDYTIYTPVQTCEEFTKLVADNGYVKFVLALDLNELISNCPSIDAMNDIVDEMVPQGVHIADLDYSVAGADADANKVHVCVEGFVDLDELTSHIGYAQLRERSLEGKDYLRKFFEVEVRNEGAGGIAPATLGSALESWVQAPDDVLVDWCGIEFTDAEKAQGPEKVAAVLAHIKSQFDGLVSYWGTDKLLPDLLDA